MKMYFATIAFAIVSTIAFRAHASTYYFVNGKAVANQGEAKKAAFQDPKALVVKIQATQVQMNPETFNLKKSTDLSLEQVKEIVK